MSQHEIEKLLSVLDMSEESDIFGFSDQMYWVGKNVVTDLEDHQSFLKGYISLADLAFDLRNEVSKNNSKSLHTGMMYVYNHANKDQDSSEEKFYTWWLEYAQPIHWIIASLIAKNLVEEENERRSL